MADAAHHVMDQPPAVTEQNQLAEDRTEQAIDEFVPFRTGCCRQQPCHRDQHAKIEHEAGDAMKARHEKSQAEPVYL